MENKKEVPVLLITGYLGSGKTTLLNRILSNKEGIKFAVIVNDIGEVNIDADLIQLGGVVNKSDSSLVALQNGCICCTLQNDLIAQVQQILEMNRFDYIVIEASGVCDPVPIAQTLCSIPALGDRFNKHGILKLDCITTVVDALRMQEEFNYADKLTSDNLDEEDIENLLIQQIEFCNVILLNKASEVSSEGLGKIKQILRALQPKAEIIECDYADVELKKLLDTHSFNFSQVSSSAGWINELNKSTAEKEGLHEVDEHEHHSEHEEDGEPAHSHHEAEEHHHHDNHHHEETHEHHHHDCDGHHCHHHHHHHNDNGEVEEYGIGTYVYFNRRPFNLDKFELLVNNLWPINIIRAKGICYFAEKGNMSFLFEQAGSQKQLTELGFWYSAMPEEDIEFAKKKDPNLTDNWDKKYGDRMQKIVLIGQNLDKEDLKRALDFCLEDE